MTKRHTRIPTRPKPTEMSRDQWNYAQALALYQVRKEAFDNDIKAAAGLEQAAFEVEFDAAEERHRLPEAKQLLRLAEDAMIEWAFAYIKSHAGYWPTTSAPVWIATRSRESPQGDSCAPLSRMTYGWQSGRPMRRTSP